VVPCHTRIAGEIVRNPLLSQLFRLVVVGPVAGIVALAGSGPAWSGLITAAAIAQPLVEKITYDSGDELTGPKQYAFNEYWSDWAWQVDWKLPVARRGMMYNASLPSADGRLLFLTMMQSSPADACGSRCPVRVFTAQHRKVMDVQACSDRTQHGVSDDHRSFVACGETFAIPQVDDRTVKLDNASPGDAEAAVEAVRRERSMLANAQASVSVDYASHNGSIMRVREWKDGTVEIGYDDPRAGLPVAPGALVFRGIRDGARYSGTAYTFKAGCPPAPYAVAGIKDSKNNTIVLTGAAPHRDPRSCGIIGRTALSGHARLVFDTGWSGDE
jgi:hypothetical protein